MQIKLASRFSEVKESATEKMAAATREMVAKGQPVINFTVGEPNFGVPQPVQQAAIQAIQQGFSKYSPVPGFPELRQRLSRKLKEENGLNYPADRIVVTCGAKQAIFNFLLAIIGEGDEVIIPAPYWVSYPEMVKIAGGTPVIASPTQQEGFKLTPALLKKHLSARTKALILNSPCNPTGLVYSKQEYAALAKALEGTNVLVCSDEIYEKLIYGVSFASFGQVSEDAFNRTITVNGFSKAYAMTGWRLGYAAGPKIVIDAMRVLQGQSTSGANSVTQKAALAALELTDRDLQPAVDNLRQGRDLMMGIFAKNHQVSFVEPHGAFYLFVNVGKYLGKQVPTSDEMGLYLLRKAYVGIVPGAGFGAESFIRLSFAASRADIEQGSTKILAALEELH